MLGQGWFGKRREPDVQHQVVHLEAALAQLDWLVCLGAAHQVLAAQTQTIQALRAEIDAHRAVAH